MFTPEETIAFLKSKETYDLDELPKPYSDVREIINKIDGLYFTKTLTEREPSTNINRIIFAFMVSEKAQPIFNNIYIELSNIVEDPDKLIQVIQRRPVNLRRDGELIYNQSTYLFFIMHYLEGNKFDMMMRANIFACDLRDAIKLACGELSNFKHLDSVIEKMKGN